MNIHQLNCSIKNITTNIVKETINSIWSSFFQNIEMIEIDFLFLVIDCDIATQSHSRLCICHLFCFFQSKSKFKVN